MSFSFSTLILTLHKGVSAQDRGQQQENKDGTRGELQRVYGDGRRRLRPFLLAGSVTQRRVAAGDAHGVELARTELLVARGSDKTGSR